jgi:hypothetical protein
MHMLTSESKFEGSRTTDNSPMDLSRDIIHRTRALKAARQTVQRLPAGSKSACEGHRFANSVSLVICLAHSSDVSSQSRCPFVTHNSPVVPIVPASAPPTPDRVLGSRYMVDVRLIFPGLPYVKG